MTKFSSAKTFQNPVYDRSFPDPFVLKHRGEYFAFCTGSAPDGRCFGRLRSSDLATWEEIRGAMQPLTTGEPFYWAPELFYLDGRFYLYYSVGNETLMTIRVAVSDTPDGDFIDTGRELTEQDFAIDPHIFRDTDGRVFMFYATDFLEHSHIGTGTVVDEMVDPLTLKGAPRPVTRARFDWQVYDPARKEKGGVRWHTVEGPFVLKRKGIYYEMFSGGNWQNISYGVSFAITHSIDRDTEWNQYCDGINILPIMRTLPGSIIGPGHNSVVEGPNNRELYCVYHRWEGDSRVLCIDRMDFAGDGRLYVRGPSFEPQPAPFKPAILDKFDEWDGDRWIIRNGVWPVTGNELISGSVDATIVTAAPGPSFLCKVYVRLADVFDAEGGVILYSESGDAAKFTLASKAGRKFARWLSGDNSREYELRADIDLAAIHELSIDVDNRFVKLAIDNTELIAIERLGTAVAQIGLLAKNKGCAFSAFALTEGFEDLFEVHEPEIRGWRITNSEFQGDLLRAVGDDRGDAQLSREVGCDNFELAINVRFADHESESASLTISCGGGFAITPAGKWSITSGTEHFPLPENLSPADFHQFRFVSLDGRTAIWLDDLFIGTVIAATADRLNIIIRNSTVFFDMIRYTAI